MYNDEKLATSKKIPNSRLECKNRTLFMTIHDQHGQN